MAVQGPHLRLSLFPRVFMKIMEGALAPLWEVGIRNLNYRDDWLIMAQSRDQLCDHRELVLSHLRQLGLRVQLGKEQALTCVENLFPHYGVRLGEYDGASHQRVLNCLSSFRGRTVVPLKLFQSLLGHMASTATVTQLGLLHMIPLQHWLHSRVPRWAWRCGTHCVTITPICCHSFSPWLDLAFLRAQPPLPPPTSRHCTEPVFFLDRYVIGSIPVSFRTNDTVIDTCVVLSPYTSMLKMN